MSIVISDSVKEEVKSAWRGHLFFVLLSGVGTLGNLLSLTVLKSKTDEWLIVALSIVWAMLELSCLCRFMDDSLKSVKSLQSTQDSVSKDLASEITKLRWVSMLGAICTTSGFFNLGWCILNLLSLLLMVLFVARVRIRLLAFLK